MCYDYRCFQRRSAAVVRKMIQCSGALRCCCCWDVKPKMGELGRVAWELVVLELLFINECSSSIVVVSFIKILLSSTRKPAGSCGGV